MTNLIKLRYKIKFSYFAWILQFPIFQQLAYFAIFLELFMINSMDNKNLEKNQHFTQEFNNSTEKTKTGNATIEIAKECYMLEKKKIRVMNDFLQLKLFEAFLEAAPQAILQIMIVFRRGFSDPMDIFTISTSLLSLTLCAINLFWKYPTQVIVLTLVPFHKTSF